VTELGDMFAALAQLPFTTMGTRRWVGELEPWMRRAGLSKDELVERSEHSTPPRHEGVGH